MRKKTLAHRKIAALKFFSMGVDENDELVSENPSLYVCKILSSSSLFPASYVGESSGRTSGGGYTGHHPGPEPGSVLL